MYGKKSLPKKIFGRPRKARPENTLKISWIVTKFQRKKKNRPEINEWQEIKPQGTTRGVWHAPGLADLESYSFQFIFTRWINNLFQTWGAPHTPSRYQQYVTKNPKDLSLSAVYQISKNFGVKM